MIENIISAELPTDSDDKNLVMQFMQHNCNDQCMSHQVCTREYPKVITPKTHLAIY